MSTHSNGAELINRRIMKNYRLHLIRHGITQGNLDGIFVGSGEDMPLCEEGIKDIDRMLQQFEYPNVPFVFVSPLMRARQTADLLYPHHEKIVMQNLREAHFGDFEGKPLAEIMNNPEYVKWFSPQSEFVPNGGESGAQFAARCKEGLLEMFRYMMECKIFEAACITHGGVIMTMLGSMAYPRKQPFEWMTQNVCGYTVMTSAAMLMRDECCEVCGMLPHKNEKN